VHIITVEPGFDLRILSTSSRGAEMSFPTWKKTKVGKLNSSNPCGRGIWKAARRTGDCVESTFKVEGIREEIKMLLLGLLLIQRVALTRYGVNTGLKCL